MLTSESGGAARGLHREAVVIVVGAAPVPAKADRRLRTLLGGLGGSGEMPAWGRSPQQDRRTIASREGLQAIFCGTDPASFSEQSDEPSFDPRRS
jgi:hypothetical protein